MAEHTYIGYKPFPWQLAVHSALEKHTNKTIITVLSRRQCGKSQMASNILLERAINCARSIGIYIAPTFKQVKKFYNDLYSAIGDSGILSSSNKSDFEFIFKNGSSIICLSAAQKENLRGYTVKNSYLIIDEAAFISDNIFDIVLPYTNVHRTNTIIISTPLFTSGRFYDCYNKGLQGIPGYVTISFNDYDTSALLDADLLEQYRLNLPENTFRTEYLGQFVKGSGLVFKNFMQCVRKQNTSLTDLVPKYVGVDWSTGQATDKTIVTLMNKKFEVLELVKYDTSSPMAIIDSLTKLLNQFRDLLIVVERNSIGAVYSSIIQNNLDKSHKLVEFNTSNSSKKEIIENLIVAFDNSKISLPNDPELIHELEIFTSTYSTDTRTLRFSAPNGLHDDRVLSLAFCWYATTLKTSSYCFSV